MLFFFHNTGTLPTARFHYSYMLPVTTFAPLCKMQFHLTLCFKQSAVQLSMLAHSHSAKPSHSTVRPQHYIRTSLLSTPCASSMATRRPPPRYGLTMFFEVSTCSLRPPHGAHLVPSCHSTMFSQSIEPQPEFRDRYDAIRNGGRVANSTV